ncbi:Glycosyl transferase family 39, partial [human gut metagenome]
IGFDVSSMNVLNCKPDWLNNIGGTVIVIAEYKVISGTKAYISSLKNDVIVLFYSLVATKYLTYTLPAIIPCIIWAAVKICELVTDKETGEFTQSFKKFNYLITLPLGIYYMIF